MASVELEVPPASFKSAVWEHFGFPVQHNSDGERVVDRTKTVCRRCFTEVRYVAGNTSNMLTHTTPSRHVRYWYEEKNVYTTTYPRFF